MVPSPSISAIRGASSLPGSVWPLGLRGAQGQQPAGRQGAHSTLVPLSCYPPQGRNVETAAHGASGEYFQSLENRGVWGAHHFPLAPVVCSEEIWRLRQSEKHFFVQEILEVVSLVKEKKCQPHI